MRYDTVEEQGRMIVISHPDFTDVIAPFVDWKNQKGIPCELYTTSDTGTGYSSIDSIIEDQYDLGDGLTFVLLVGDDAQVQSYSNGEDPVYGCIEGSDYYPELFVGRFSGTTDAHIETQVERTIEYERDVASGSWLHKGLGIASNQGTGDDGEYDDDHIDNIRDKLLAYTYTEVGQEYDSNGGSVGDAMNIINNGISIINYCGHGSTTSWGNGAPLNTSHVNALENDNELPFIISVACVVGNFMSSTCFAEAWLRATNSTTDAPTGAVAFYGSTVNQSWNPPMRAEDHVNDLLVGWNYSSGSAIDQKYTYSGLCFNGSCNMMDVYGTSGDNEFRYWTIFGDPSLLVRTDTPATMPVSHDASILTGQTSFVVSTGDENALTCLYDGADIVGYGYADGSGNVTLTLDPPPVIPQDLTLTVTANNKTTYIETVPVIASGGPYVVIESYSLTSGGDTIIEPGETALLSITLANNGSDVATSVGLTITETNDYISLTDANQAFGTISAHHTATQNNAFSFVVAGDIPDEHPIVLNCLINCNEDSWNYQLNFSAFNPPVIAIDPMTFTETLPADETSTQNLNIGNSGGADLNYSLTITETTRGSENNSNNYSMREYCDASGGCDESISRVQFGDIDNSSGCTGYGEYSLISTDITIGQSYGITVTIDNPYSGDVGGLWIDWNHDEDFDDTGETITTSWSGSGPYTTTVIPPEYALFGPTIMRIRLTWNVTPAPCGTNSYGEVEDYTVNIMSDSPNWILIDDSYSASGSVPLGADDDILSVGFNSTDLTSGVYTAEISVVSNDPDDPVHIIPVTLNVNAAPEAPANVQVEMTDTSITLSWDPVAGAQSYKIYSSTNPADGFHLLEIVLSSSTIRSYPLSGNMMFFKIYASTDSVPE